MTIFFQRTYYFKMTEQNKERETERETNNS